MNILIDAHVFDGKFQGSRTYIKGLYSEMIKKKSDWHFYFAGSNVDTLQEEFGSKKNITYLKLRATNKYIRLLFELPYLSYKHKIDFSHFQYVSPPIKIGKYIVTNHDILFEEERFKQYFPNKYRWVNSFLFKYAARKANILLTVSDYSKNKINEFYNIPKEQIHVTPNAIQLNTETTKTNLIKKKYGCEKYLLYVSRVEPRKNHISVVKAFINLKLYEHGYQLVFIGNRDMEDKELTNYITENRKYLQDNLRFFSNVPDTDLKQFYLNAEVVVYPSFAEGFGIPPLEGAVYKRKVVCSSSTAMAEFTFFKYLVNPNNQKEIEEAISKALKDDEKGLDKIQEFVLQTYTWSRGADVLEKEIEKHYK